MDAEVKDAQQFIMKKLQDLARVQSQPFTTLKANLPKKLAALAGLEPALVKARADVRPGAVKRAFLAGLLPKTRVFRLIFTKNTASTDSHFSSLRSSKCSLLGISRRSLRSLLEMRL